MSKEKVTVYKPKDIRDTRDLRQFLIRSMIAADCDEMDAAKAKSICNLAQQIHNTLTVEQRAAVLADKLGVKAIEPVKL